MLGFLWSMTYGLFWLVVIIFGLLSAGQLVFAIAKMINRELVRQPMDLSQRYGKGTWAVVTGATGGIGFEFCQQLAKLGFNIVLVSRRLELLNNCANQLEIDHPQIRTEVIQYDFRKENTVDDYKGLKNKLKDLDISILVNNAGKAMFKYFKDVEPQETMDLVNINCTSYAMLTHQLISDLLKREKRSAIINVSSLASYSPIGFQGGYSATKRMIRYFTYGLADNYSNKIDVLGLNPGMVETKMTESMDASESDTLFFCTADVTVKNTLRDLGYEIETTGWWAHTILGGITEITYRYAFPLWNASSKGMMEKYVLRSFRKETLAKKQA